MVDFTHILTQKPSLPLMDALQTLCKNKKKQKRAEKLKTLNHKFLWHFKIHKTSKNFILKLQSDKSLIFDQMKAIKF